MGQTGYHSKRLRTTIGSGHGLANIIDRSTVNEYVFGRRDDAEQNSSDLADDHFFQVKHWVLKRQLAPPTIKRGSEKNFGRRRYLRQVEVWRVIWHS